MQEDPTGLESFKSDWAHLASERDSSKELDQIHPDIVTTK